MTLKYRFTKDKIAFFLICFLSFVMAIPLFAIIGEVVYKGCEQFNISFFTEIAPTTYDAMIANQAGSILPGGIVNGITGTIFMVTMASLVAIPLGIFAGVYVAEERRSWLAGTIRFMAELIQGTPSIIVGVIVYSWVVVPFKSYSALAGSVALAIMMLPLIVRATEETIKMLPVTLKEAALALGASYQAVILKILIPSAGRGILTGVLLAVSRVIGETAPLMITALGSSMINWDALAPTSSVPLLIWEFYNDPNLVNLIWSSSFFLLSLVLTLNIIAKYIINKSNK